MNKSDCVAAAERAGATRQEATDIVDSLLEEKARLKEGSTPADLSGAWDEQASALAHQQAVLQRRQALAAMRYGEARDFIESVRAQGFSGMDAIQAILVGSSKRFNGARNSVTTLRNGIHRSWLAPMMRELEAVGDGSGLRMMRKDKTFHDNVFREMREPDSTGNAEARQIAGIFAKYMEQSRQLLNEAGADIGKLDGWTPQNHDPYKLMRDGDAGRQKWIDYILPRLDLERTFESVANLDEARAREILGNVFDTLTAGKDPHTAVDFSGGGRVSSGPRNMASGMGKSRVLHFRDASAALEYHNEYGRGNIFDAMVRRLEMDARNLALMQKLGPNPQYTVERLLDREKSLVRQNTSLSDKEKTRQLESLRAAYNKGGFTVAGKVSHWLAELSGETSWPMSRTAARVGSFLRATQTLAKLGGASLSAVADIFTKAANMRCNGLTWPQSIVRSLGDYLRDYGEGRKEVARQCGAFLDYVNMETSARWDDSSGMPGVLADLQDKMFRLSGLNWITERGKAGYTLWLSEHLGSVADRAWADLDAPRRAMLEYHNVSEVQWDAMRKMVEKAEDNKTYFSPELADALTEADLAGLLPPNYQALEPEARQRALDRARRKLRYDSMGMMVDETGFAIIEPDDATRAIMRQGTRPGTVAGEFWRAIMQFKSFPIAYMQRELGGRRWIRGDRQQGQGHGFNLRSMYDATVGRDLGGLVAFALASITFGYASMCLKDLAKGREIRDIGKKETWFAAAIQSGGAGIFGDFLFGKVNRFGNDFAATAAGPLGGLIGDLTKVGGQLVRGEYQEAGEDSLRLALNNAPFINLWWARGGLDWLALYHVREMLSPGSLQRMERNLKKDFNQEYFVSPSQHIRRGGGWK